MLDIESQRETARDLLSDAAMGRDRLAALVRALVAMAFVCELEACGLRDLELLDGPVGAADYEAQESALPTGPIVYVATDGNDASTTGSITSPLASLNEAATRLPGGGTIMVRGGTYTTQQQGINATGTISRPLVIQSAPGETAVFDGSSVSANWTGVITLSTAQNVEFQGLEIRNCTADNCAAIVSSTNAQNLAIRGCHIHDLDGAAVRLFGSGIRLEANNLHDIALANTNNTRYPGGGWPTCLGVVPNKTSLTFPHSTNVTVKDNLIKNCWGDGIGLAFVTDAIVAGNVVTNAFNEGISLDNSSGAVVSRNFVTVSRGAQGSHGAGIVMHTKPHPEVLSDKIASHDIRIANNVVVAGAGIGWWKGTNATDSNTYRAIAVVHNTIVSDTGRALGFDGVNEGVPPPVGCLAQNNLLSEIGTSSLGNPSGWVVAQNGWLNKVPPLAGTRIDTVVPRITAALDARLLVLAAGSGSPGAGAATDFAGMGRNTTAPTRGAFEDTGVHYFVSPGATDDSSPGTSATSPLRTIAAASARALPGDTIFLMGGDYIGQSIAPARSGTRGRPITYLKYRSETATIVGGANQAALSDRRYIVIDGINFKEATGAWVSLNAGSLHNRFANGTFTTAFATWSGFDLSAGAAYNRFDHNVITSTCAGGGPPIDLGGGAVDKNLGSGGPGNHFTLKGDAHHNIIENNKFKNASHYNISIQDGYSNIIRNNQFSNRWHAAVAFFSAAGTVHDNVLDGNKIYDSGEDHFENLCDRDKPRSWTWPRNKFSGLQLDATSSIVRYNQFVNNGQTNIKTYVGDSFYNRIYNNTFAFNYISVFLVGEVTPRYPDVLSNNVYKNNVFYSDREYAVFAPSVPTVSAPIGTLGLNRFRSNNLFSAPVTYRNSTGPLSAIELAFETEWGANTSLDPRFVDARSKDLRLDSSSELINNGAFLTAATVSGNRVTLQVSDSHFFSDGFGIVDGDVIQLAGSPQTSRIVKVDHVTRTLTLSNALSFSAGQGVSLAYKGGAPDMGAVESGF